MQDFFAILPEEKKVVVSSSKRCRKDEWYWHECRRMKCMIRTYHSGRVLNEIQIIWCESITHLIKQHRIQIELDKNVMNEWGPLCTAHTFLLLTCMENKPNEMNVNKKTMCSWINSIRDEIGKFRHWAWIGKRKGEKETCNKPIRFSKSPMCNKWFQCKKNSELLQFEDFGEEFENLCQKIYASLLRICKAFKNKTKKSFNYTDRLFLSMRVDYASKDDLFMHMLKWIVCVQFRISLEMRFCCCFLFCVK